MEDCPVIDETCLSGRKPLEGLADEPIELAVRIDPEYKDAFYKCLEKVEPMGFQDMMFAALGIYLTKLYLDKYTTNQDTTE